MLEAPTQVFHNEADFLEASTRLLRAFMELDPGMSLNAIMILLMVRKAQADKRSIAAQDMSQELQIHPATISRVLTYLGDGKADEGFNGLALIRVDIDKIDRRRRTVTFTNKGWRAMRRIMQAARKQEEE